MSLDTIEEAPAYFAPLQYPQDVAVCWVRDEIPLSVHTDVHPKDHATLYFRATQMAYVCWSWWKTNPHTKHELMITARLQEKWEAMRVLNGLLNVFRKENVEVVRAAPVHSYILEPDPNRPFFCMPSHARQLRDASVTAVRAPSLGRLRVLIVNRRPGSGRHLANEKQLADAISAAANGVAIVKIANFDDRTSFQEQVDLIHGNDIMVGPVGGQAILVPFLTDCGGWLEIQSAEYADGFIRALAVSSGLLSVWVYPRPGMHPDQGALPTMASGQTRVYYERAPLRPAVELAVAAFLELAEARVRCLGRDRADGL
eukprot:gnl/TRDRNA2_/TRDRNA2_63690_c1_seq1.p1 gnl/TRDRNA2_/TRDRNA2_63690_c1~~gnl/TRDRNA2_/TRDRNA2_63690_c1_seq1.p1  ORF type:complete len:356 (-),score=52.99 gnl/TRDRNA2_/TRDRNA2_63690_c1_seq1:49-990(-)